MQCPQRAVRLHKLLQRLKRALSRVVLSRLLSTVPDVVMHGLDLADSNLASLAVRATLAQQHLQLLPEQLRLRRHPAKHGQFCGLR